MKSYDRNQTVEKLKMAGLMVLLAVVLTVVLRGIVAYQQKVFTTDQVRQRLPADARLKLDAYDASIKQKQNTILSIDQELTKEVFSLSSDKIRSLLELRTALTTEVSNSQPPIKIDSFINGNLLLVWPLIYASCLVLVTVQPPVKLQWSKRLCIKALLLSGLIFFTYRFVTYARNLYIHTGRTVFAGANWDISPVYAFVQELIVAGFCGLVAVMWIQWSTAATNEREKYDPNATNLKLRVFDCHRVKELSDLFADWLVNSALLALAFVFYTRFFWNYLVDAKDSRYLLSAVIIHLYWGVSWILISAPLWHKWKSWYLDRLELLAQLAIGGSSETDSKAILSLLERFQPIPIWQAVGGLSAGVVTFLIPSIKAVVHW